MKRMEDALAVSRIRVRYSKSRGSAQSVKVNDNGTRAEDEPPAGVGNSPKTKAPDGRSIPNEICVNNSSSSAVEEEQPYRVGDRVEAKYRGKGRRYYLGTIKAVLPGEVDRYDVDYDDGDTDKGLPAEFVRRMQASDKVAPTAISPIARTTPTTETIVSSGCGAEGEFEVGQKVEARYRGRGRRYYKGTISGVLPNGLYNVQYDDGDKDRNLAASAIRAMRTPGADAEPKTEAVSQSQTNGNTADREAVGQGVVFEVGQKIEARYKGRGRR